MTTTNATPTTASPALALRPEQVKQYHEQGYLGPLVACSEDDMANIRQHIDREILNTPGPSPNAPHQCRHMDHRVVYDLCTRPEILDPMASILGPDLLLWAVNFFVKEPGGNEIPWHQDANYWPIEPPINISAWLAIDPVTTENSCVRLIPGSHKNVIPHVPSSQGMAFGEMADPHLFNADDAIEMPLRPGEFFLFNERLLHQSHPNRSTLRRFGMSMRVTVPIVRIEHDVNPLFPGHAAMLVRGHDTMHFNRLMRPPSPKALTSQDDQ